MSPEKSDVLSQFFFLFMLAAEALAVLGVCAVTSETWPISIIILCAGPSVYDSCLGVQGIYV